MPVTADNTEYSQLSQLVPLNTLSEDTLKELLLKVDIEVIQKGDVLFREGDVDHVNVYLLSGRVGLYSGNSQVDLVEESSATSRFPIAHQLPRKFAAKALSRMDIVRIDSRILSEALAQNEKTESQVEVEIGEEGDDEDWMTQLLQSRVMQNIPAANLQGVMMRMQETVVSEGDIVIQEGDEGDYYYLLHRGQAIVLKAENDLEEPVEVARLNAGASFGEDALLSDRPRSSTVKMATDGILLRLSKDDFIELIKHPLSETVSFAEAQSILDEGGMWLDVRDADAYDNSHLPGAINMPYSTLRFQLPSLATDRPYVIYSQSGTRAIASAYLFLERGLQVSVLDGGYDRVALDQPEADQAPDSPVAEQLSESGSAVADTASQNLTTDAQEAVADLNTRLEELQKQLAQKDVLLAEAKDKFAKMADQAPSESSGADSQEVAQLKKQNEKLQREIIGLTEQLESEEDVYDKLKQQYDALSSENKKHLQLRDADIASLKEQLTVMQLEKDQVEMDYEELLEKQGDSTIDSDSDGQSEKLQHALNQIDQLEALNASITEDRDNTRYELEEIRNQLSLLQQDHSELQLEISDLKGRLAEQSG